MKNKIYAAGVSLAAISVFGSVHFDSALAQSAAPTATDKNATLPAVTIDAPKQRQARSKPPKRQQASGAARRSRAGRANPNAPAPTANSGVQKETITGHVDGYVATLTGTGSKMATPIRELPQTVNVITADQIRDQGAQSVTQALSYTPGVLAGTYGGASQFDAYTQIRGFQADIYLDGQRLPNGATSTAWASSVIDPFGLERIEVLKGPSSGLYGQSPLGGLINLTSKRPTDYAFGEIQGTTYNFGGAQTAFDFGGPANADKTVLYRITGLVREANTQTDFMGNNRVYIAPAVTWRPNADTKFTILSNYQREWGGLTSFNYVPSYGSLYPNVNGRIPYSRYMGDPNFDRFNREQASAGYEFEHRFNEALTVRQNLRVFNVNTDLRALNRVGDFTSPTQTTINRRAFGIDANATSVAVDNQAELHFLTGALAHTTLVGLDYRAETNHYNTGIWPLPPGSISPPFNVYNPVYGNPSIVDPGTTTNLSSTREQQVGVYVQDQIKFDRWVATVGGRYDNARADTTAVATVPTLSTVFAAQRADATTGRVGLNYLFDNGVTPYIGYSTAFQPQPGVDFFNNPYKPTTGDQIEVGVKYQPPGTKTLITIAGFDINQQNRLTADFAHPGSGKFIQTAGARVRGVEFEAKTEITRELNVIASYAHLDHEVTASANPADIGKKLAQVPNDQAALWAMYEFHQGSWNGFGIGGGVRYIGKTWDINNTTVTPGYTLVDARLQYDLSQLDRNFKGTMLSVNAINLFNKYYVSQCTTGTGCTLGVARTVLATISHKW